MSSGTVSGLRRWFLCCLLLMCPYGCSFLLRFFLFVVLLLCLVDHVYHCFQLLGENGAAGLVGLLWFMACGDCAVNICFLILCLEGSMLRDSGISWLSLHIFLCTLCLGLFAFLLDLFVGHVITKTYLYKFDPHKPHFYIVKLGFTVVYIIFLISAQKHRLWVLVSTASARRC